MHIRPPGLVAASALAVIAVSTAWATTNFANAPQGAHYRQGSTEPACAISGLNVSCTGTQIAGVGNTDADLVLSVSYSATVDCTNRGGKLVPVKTQITTASSNDEDTDVRNGTLFVSAINVSSPPTEDAFKNAATCPNGNWTKSMPAGSPAVSAFTYTLTFDGFNAPVVIVVFPAP